MGKVLEPADTIAALLDRLDRAESRLRTLESTSRARALSIDEGSLVVRGGALVAEDTDGSTLVYIGQGVLPGVPDSAQAFMFLARASGQIFFRLNSLLTGDQYWAWYDETGNIIFADDTVSGQGLARPYLPLPWRPATSSINTNGHYGIAAGGFADLFVVEGLKQHPQLKLALSAFHSDASTSGEIRLIDPASGTVLGPVITVPAGVVSTAQYTITTPAPGAHLSQIRLVVQAQRTAGAGTFFAVPRFVYGVQS